MIGTIKAAALLAAATFMSICLMPPGGAQAQFTATNLICNGCVGKKDIGKNAVTSKSIKNKSIKPADLHNKAKPGGADSFETSTDTFLSGGDDIVATVTVKAPGPGIIQATASTFIDFNAISGTVFCEVTTGTTTADFAMFASGVEAKPVSITRQFPVASAGDVTINFVCDEVSGNVEVHNPILAAIFVPGAY